MMYLYKLLYKQVIFLASILTSANILIGQWTMGGGDPGQSRYVPGIYDSSTFVTAWQIHPGQAAAREYNLDLATDGQKLYVSIKNENSAETGPFDVVAIDRITHEEIWRTSFMSSAGSHPISAPSLHNGIVYINRYGYSWSYNDDTELGPALIGMSADDGHILFNSGHAGQKVTGSRPTISGDLVFVAGGFYKGMDAYDATSGDWQWYSEHNTSIYRSFPLLAYEDLVVTKSRESRPGVHVTDGTSGTINYSITHPDNENIIGQIIGSDGTIYSYSEHYTQARDLNSGELLWSQQMETARGIRRSSVAVSDNILAIGSAFRVEFRDASTGDLLHTYTDLPASDNFRSVTLTDSHAVIGYRDEIRAINLSTYSSDWSMAFDPTETGFSTADIAISDGLLYLSDMRSITAVRIAEPDPIKIFPTLDARATLVGSSSIVQDGDQTIITQDIDFADIDRRGVMEFSLDRIPANATILDATLTLEISSFTSSPEQPFPVLSLYGYEGNGVLDMEDALISNSVLGISSEAPRLDAPLVISLDAEFIQELVETGSYLGILAVGDEQGHQIAWYTTEAGETARPQLDIRYDWLKPIPEPSTLSIIAMTVMTLVYQSRQRSP